MAVMNKKQHSLSLAVQIAIPILGLLVITGLTIFAWSFYISKTALESELALDLEKTKSIVALSLDNTLNDIKDDLIEMSLAPDFKKALASDNSEEIERKLYNFLSSKQGYLLDILEVFKGGNHLVDAGIFPVPIMQLKAKHKNALTTSPVWEHLTFQGTDTIKTILICSIPITNSKTGEVYGALYGGIDLNSNVSFLDSLRSSSGAIDAALITKKRLLISSHNKSENKISKLIKWAHGVSSDSYLIREDRIFSTIHLLEEQTDSPLLYTFSKRNPSFQALKTNYMKSLGIMLTLALLLSAITAWMMQNRILNALKKLTNYAHSVVDGSSETSFERGSVKEFNQLGKNLETMVSSLDKKSTYISKLFSSATAPIITCNLDGKILDMNPAAEKLASALPSKFKKRSLEVLFPDKYSQDIGIYLGRAVAGQTPPVAVIPISTISGEELFFVWTFSPVNIDQKGSADFILLQGQDVTENRKAVKKVLESEARLRQIIDLLPQEIFANDINGKFILVNKNKAKRLGRIATELTGKHLSEVIDNQDEIARIQNDDQLVIDREDKLLIEESYVDENRDIHWLETTKVPYLSTETHTRAILTISMDITRIKNAESTLQLLNKELVERVSMRTIELENANSALTKSMDDLRKTQNKLVETEKMASLGELVAGIAHEINTPLGIGVTSTSYLKGMTEDLQEQFDSSSLKKSNLEKYIKTSTIALTNIVKNLNRAAKLISDFKQLAVDQSTDDLRNVNLRDYIDGILISLKPNLKDYDYSLEIDCPDDLDIILSPGSLMLVISNLMMNSLTHGFPNLEHGSLSISAHKKNEGVILTYSDNGIGMSREQLEKIYDPFYTTKRSAGNTGLGMHLVYNLVTRALKGKIECKSTIGSGTTFEIWFPAGTSEQHKNTRLLES
ncbi:PAS domain-containing protein [Maridesulfovibrio frigidus]|uniref:PAS domain-containing protein n=1 Tax=Maridesulfovibrio frigidus TaxID=340956 RepID=UPI00068C0F3F|nr:PAS domain-containing protein [Maridesulfovibrio frigidus]